MSISTSVKTGEKYKYSRPVWERPTAADSSEPINILFSVDASSDAHVWLSDGSANKSKGYEVVIGGWKNTRSEIRKGQQGSVTLACVLHMEAPLCSGEDRKFWLSVQTRPDSVTIVVGSGWNVWKNKMLVAVDKSSKRVGVIESVSVSTGFGSSGSWNVIVTHSSSKADLEKETKEGVEGAENVKPSQPTQAVVAMAEPIHQKTNTTISASMHARQTPIKDTLVFVGGGISSSKNSSSLTPSTGLLKRPRSSLATTPQSVRVEVSPSQTERESMQRNLKKTMATFQSSRDIIF